MNQRIRELADQILPNEKEWHKGDPKDWGYFFSSDELEKFAELLIRKCAMKANATALDLRNYPELDGRKYVGDCILKCFEVES
jgi:hypothetical protein